MNMNKAQTLSQSTHLDEHRDDIGSRFGMWLFIFTELLLFAGLFITYSVYRFKNPQAFHLAAEELDTFIGALNTVLLLGSSMTIAMSITALQKKQKNLYAPCKIISLKNHWAQVLLFWLNTEKGLMFI